MSEPLPGGWNFHPKTKEDMILHDEERVRRSLLAQGVTGTLAQWLALEYAEGQRNRQRIFALQKRVTELETK